MTQTTTTTTTPDHTSRSHDPFSPSQLKALYSCPGYQGRDEASAAAEMGTRIHEALEVRDPAALQSDLEIELYNMCIKAEDNIIEKFFVDVPYMRLNERPLDIPLNGGLSTRGTADVMCFSKSRVLMIDYKTGMSSIDDVEENWQARAYALGAFHTYPDVEEVTFIFLCPQQDTILTGVFTRDDIDHMRHAVTNVVGTAMKVRAKWEQGTPSPEDLTPNEHCVWCRYQTLCPALHEIMITTAKAYDPVNVPETIDLKKTEDPDHVADLYTIAKILEPLISAIKKKAVILAQEGEVLPGWRLQSMGASSKATDNLAFLEYAKSFGVTLDDLINMVNIPVAQVRNLVKERQKAGDKGKVAKQFIDQALEKGVIEKGTERMTLKPDLEDLD